jgi:ComF family protein
MTRAGAELINQADALAPIPLHYTRLWRRQFNQAAALAREIARLSGKPCETSLIERVRPTRSQVGLTRSQRARNMQGAFRVRPAAKLEGRRIVLVDDVLTSGSTANAAASVLLRGGAKSVDVLVFAQVVRS